MADSLERRLRAALEGSSEAAPRPLTPIELPLKLEKLLTRRVLKSLKRASVLVPVIRRGRALRVVFTRRSEDMPSHKGQISFPGGRRTRADRSAAATALREAQEEVGIPPAAVEVVGYLDDYPTVTGFLVTPVVAVVSNVRRLRPCAREVAEVFEAPLGFVTDPVNFERKLFARAGIRVPYYEVNFGRHRIWGATAGMLWNLAQKMSAD